LLAFERLLEKAPSLRHKVIFIQVAAPSRIKVPAYEKFRRQVDEIVGRVNGRFGGPSYQPIHYVTRPLPQSDVVKLYGVADVMIVTPLRDGMNLVAKEFVACRRDGDGVLVLSEFAGAAAELGEALIVNPFDIDQVASAMLQAIEMPANERLTRMAALRERLQSFDSEDWCNTFIGLLQNVAEEPKLRAKKVDANLLLEKIGDERLLLLLDYDGTLVPIAPTPQLAIPDADLLALLKTLVEETDVEVHIVSGRSRDFLEKWFGDLKIGLHAEHGYWSRLDGSGWKGPLEGPRADWKSQIIPILEQFTRETPGSLIEEKTCSIAWHYRMSDPDHAAKKANEMRFQLRDALASQPLEVIPGKKIVEVRQQGFGKGRIVGMLPLRVTNTGLRIVAIGDDHTDEEMFASLPENGISVQVGHGVNTHAKFRLSSPSEVRSFLQLLYRLRQQRRPQGSILLN
jgi:trehalose 6-phosphate synthase/phosphatase